MPVRRSNKSLAGLAVAIGAACCQPLTVRAHPHNQPWLLQHAHTPLNLRITIADEQILYEIAMSNGFFNTLIPLERRHLKLSLDGDRFRFLDPAEERLERLMIDEYFRDVNPVTIDGIHVKPILKDVHFVPAVDPSGAIDHSLLPPDVRIVFSYPAKGKPRQVSMVWEVYPRVPPRDMFGTPMECELAANLDAYEEDRIITFTRDEPEYIWHAPVRPVGRRVAPVLATTRPATIAIPTASMGAALAGAVGLVSYGVRSGRGRRDRYVLAASVGLLGLAVCVRNIAVAHVAAPWPAPATPPGDREAADIFASVLRNVYRAFDYKSESDIYDVLAESVDGQLLVRLYLEVYRTLIDREQGGAVARVKEVEVLETEVLSFGRLSESGDAAFRVRGRWRVDGVVYHWGHTHERTNEYAAIYTIAERNDRWKITAADALEEHRVEPSGERRVPTSAPRATSRP